MPRQPVFKTIVRAGRKSEAGDVELIITADASVEAITALKAARKALLNEMRRLEGPKIAKTTAPVEPDPYLEMITNQD